MSGPYVNETLLNRSPQTRPASRIDGQVERVKRLSENVDMATDRTLRHARSLGFFQDQPPSDKLHPTPVISSLEDALNELDRAVDRLSSSLSVFD